MFKRLLCVFGVFLFLSGLAWGADNKQATEQRTRDITEEVIVGPGSVSISTKQDIMMSFGATVRFIPTLESNWDFGMSDDTSGFLGNKLNGRFFEAHFNEAGTVHDGYIRNETKLYFNAMPKDKKWSFYAALEFDRPIDTDTVDNRGGRGDNSNFGLERLNASVALPFDTRLHAGWDVWGLDHYDGASMVYADDNPGFWLDGEAGPVTYSIGYFKLQDTDFQTGLTNAIQDKYYFDVDSDRDLIAGWLKYKIDDGNAVKLMYAYDRIRSVPIRDFLSTMSSGAAGITGSRDPEIDSHHIGAYWTGKFGIIELFAEGAYQFGSADNTGLARYGLANDYDIQAYALAANISVELKDFIGFSLKPRVGIMYTSGDDDPTDDKLEGYEGVENAQRFSNYWGGENTIIADTNFVLGSVLYGFLPELYGNGTPVFTGGLQNFAGGGGGRGDNPGMMMISFGITATPQKFLIYRTNVNMFWWNEDFRVTSWVNPAVTTWIDSGYAGTEWDNEITLALHKNMFIKGQFSFYFPGDVVKDVTRALSGRESDDVASRVAAELIWNF